MDVKRYASITAKATKRINEVNKETKKNPWKCPHCRSSSIALNIEKEHQHFGVEYRSLKQMIRCCDCGLQFVFEYELKKITVHSFRPILTPEEEKELDELDEKEEDEKQINVNKPTHKPCDNCSTKWMDVLYPIEELTEIKGKLYCKACTEWYLNQTKKTKKDGKIGEMTIRKDLVPEETYKKTIAKINQKLKEKEIE